MSVGASVVRHDEFLIEITTPSKTDNVPIKKNPGRNDFAIPVPAHHAGQEELLLQPITVKLDPLLGQTMLSEGNDTISQELGTLHW